MIPLNGHGLHAIVVYHPLHDATTNVTTVPTTEPSMATTLTDAGTCRHCRWSLRHTTLLDDNDQPVDRYLGANPDHGGALDALCPAGPRRTCEDCNGTGGEDGDPDTDWACQTCLGDGNAAEHQPT